MSELDLGDFGAGVNPPPATVPPAESAPAGSTGAGSRSKTTRKPAAAKKATAKRPDSAPRKPGRPSSDDKLREKLIDFYCVLGAGLALVNEADGLVILDHAERCAESLVKLANQYPAVKRALDRTADGGAIFAVIAAHGPLLYKIAANHNLAPALPDLAGAGAPVDRLGASAPAFPFDLSALTPDDLSAIQDLGAKLTGSGNGN